MKVTVYSREEVEGIINADSFPQNTAVISFCDPELKHIDKNYSRVDYSCCCDNVFYCEVDDLDLDYLPEKGYTYDSYFPEAAEAAQFIGKAFRDGKDIICQCEYGQSRSAGCAAAILEHFYRRGIDIFAEYKYYPNQVVYHKVFDALESAAFQPTEYLWRVYEYSGTKNPFSRYAVEESLNRLTQTERDILYMYLWDRRPIISIAEQAGYSDLRIEQILSKVHRHLAQYITSFMRG
ncbi:MAG: sigma-70 family RNA polymerase sigma factor [Ruminococcus sp.]|nr:sigma-70 family RNA polymerase sigma factor [Ruminococcus sp.]